MQFSTFVNLNLKHGVRNNFLANDIEQGVVILVHFALPFRESPVPFLQNGTTEESNAPYFLDALLYYIPFGMTI